MRRLSLKTVSWLGLILGLFLMFGCGSGSSSEPNPQNSINLNGGDAELTAGVSQGGKGGDVTITSDGTLTMSPTGSVNSDFPIPSDTPLNTDNTHYSVISDETVQDNEDNGLTSNLYVLDGDPHLYLGNGDGTANDSTAILGGNGGGDEIVDSLLISEGVTLKLPDNLTNEFSIELSEDILIYGEVVSEFGLSDITLDTKTNLIISSTGVISTKPTISNEDGRKITLYAGLVMINRGVIDGSGSEGGDSFGIDLDAYENLYNTGIIRADGGDNLAGSAGTAGDIILYSNNGSIYSSGTINANGGNATNGFGGQNGSIHIETLGYDSVDTLLDTRQDILISGLTEANGGNAVDGNGGNALGLINIINLADTDSQILINAALKAQSGNATGDDTAGGSGFLTSINYGGVNVLCPEGSVHMTGTINVSGGSGDKNGGNSGLFQFPYDSAIHTSPTGDIDLIYDGIIMSGGDGETGGNGGELAATSSAYFSDIDILYSGGEGDTIANDGIDGDATINGTSLP